MGEQLFAQYTCNACHSVDGTPGVGPTMQGLFGNPRNLADGSSVTADENYLRESILNPTAKVAEGFAPVMPPTYSTLTAKQLDGLIAYIKTLQ
jgi:cytochrome c oxidase subunit II